MVERPAEFTVPELINALPSYTIPRHPRVRRWASALSRLLPVCCLMAFLWWPFCCRK